MCRSIQPLFNYEPPASGVEIQAAALQYVRKVSGFRKPSQINQAVFDTAVAEISIITGNLIRNLMTSAPPRNRAAEAERAKSKSSE